MPTITHLLVCIFAIVCITQLGLTFSAERLRYVAGNRLATIERTNRWTAPLRKVLALRRKRNNAIVRSRR